MTFDLPVIFALLMGVAILAYVVLDGYDLGVGMLLPAGTPREQNFMVSSIGPFDRVGSVPGKGSSTGAEFSSTWRSWI